MTAGSTGGDPGGAESGLRVLGAGLGWAVRLAALALGVAVLPWEGAASAADAGVTVLLSAPYLATLFAAVHYLRRGAWRNAALASLLLALLVVGLWLGTGRA